jgi:membrane associated rhomboid family serine protease
VFPYKDENPTYLTPVVTIGIIILTSAVWVLVQGAGTYPRLAESVCQLGAIPAELTGRLREPISLEMGPGVSCQVSPGASWLTMVTSMFLHGGWFHILGNMWFLWVFGNNIEDAMGHGRFVGFYLVTGLIAAAAQVFTSPESAVPMVGASGAISGVMGGYLILYPRVRIHMLVFFGFFVTTIAVPAAFMLLYWAAIQFLSSIWSMGMAGQGGGVAFMAHLGGFIGGAVLIRLFARPEYVARHRRSRLTYQL